MVKLNLDWLKNSKVIIMILVVFLSLLIESSSEIIQIEDFNEMKFHNISAGLVEASKGNEKRINSNSLSVPRVIRSKSEGEFMAFNNRLFLHKGAEVENLIVNDQEFHSKLLKGSVEIYSLNYKDKFSFQSGDFIIYPKGASHILVSENGVRVLKGTVLIFEFKNGKFDKSFVLSRNQGIGSVPESLITKSTSDYLKEYFKLTNRSFEIKGNKNGKFLNINKQKHNQAMVNVLKSNLRGLIEEGNYDKNELNELGVKIVKDEKLKILIQDSFEDFIKAFLMEGEVFNSDVKDLFIQNDGFLNSFSKVQIAYLLLDELAELKNKKRLADFSDSSVIFLNFIDRFKTDLEYGDRHTIILTLNSILKNKNFWNKTVFEARSILFKENLKTLEDKIKANYEEDFRSQNMNLLKGLIQKSEKVKSARDIAETLMQDLDQNQKLEFVDKLFDL